MKERPILFSAPMVRALLDGSKTQTRRAVKLPHNNPLGRWEPTSIGGVHGGHTKDGATIPEQGAIWHTRTGDSLASPYGQPSDILWCRETCRAHEITTAEAIADTWKLGDRLGEDAPSGLDGVVYLADNVFREIENTQEAADKWVVLNAYRGQRGATVPAIHMPRWASRITLEIVSVRVERLQDISEADAYAEGIQHCDVWGDGTPRGFYRVLWEQINGAGSWDANPFVWCVSFRMVEP